MRRFHPALLLVGLATVGLLATGCGKKSDQAAAAPSAAAPSPTMSAKDKLLNAISDGSSVERQKPAPDLFLHAAAQLHLAPAECVVIEDAAAGVEAGLAAGMRTLGLGPAERVGHAHAILPNLANVGLARILKQFERGLPQ